MTVGGFTNCHGQYVPPVHRAATRTGTRAGAIPLNFGTTASINAFYVDLELHVGLCNVVKTAVSMGVHRADGKSLLTAGRQAVGRVSGLADNLASFTLGSVNVSPMTMAAAYATVAARGDLLPADRDQQDHRPAGHNLPVESAACHRVHEARESPTRPATSCAACSISGTAGRTRHRPSGRRQDRYRQRRLLRRLRRLHADPGRLRVGLQPAQPDRLPARCSATGLDFRQYPGGYLGSSGQMFGDNAPGATWEYTLHPRLPRPGTRLRRPAGVLLRARRRLGAASPAEAEAKPGGGGGNGGGGNGGGGNGGGGGERAPAATAADRRGPGRYPAPRAGAVPRRRPAPPSARPATLGVTAFITWPIAPGPVGAGLGDRRRHEGRQLGVVELRRAGTRREPRLRRRSAVA